jgi:hypothetical protein
VRILILPILGMALAWPAAAETSTDSLATLPVTAQAEVSFTPGIPLLTQASRERLKPVVAKGRAPGCFWVASGRSWGEAETLKAALAENDIAVEAIATEIRPAAAFAEARLYCAPPPRVTAYFLPGRSDLTEEARRRLALVVASYWTSSTPLVVRGYSEAKESADPLKLGLDRAQSARAFLIAQGLSPKRLAIEANTQAKGHDALRVDILPSS